MKTRITYGKFVQLVFICTHLVLQLCLPRVEVIRAFQFAHLSIELGNLSTRRIEGPLSAKGKLRFISDKPETRTCASRIFSSILGNRRPCFAASSIFFVISSSLADTWDQASSFFKSSAFCFCSRALAASSYRRVCSRNRARRSGRASFLTVNNLAVVVILSRQSSYSSESWDSWVPRRKNYRKPRIKFPSLMHRTQDHKPCIYLRGMKRLRIAWQHLFQNPQRLK